MSDVVTLENVTIVCDSCGFETIGEIEHYHNKPCPECGAPNIIDDKDVAIHDGLVALAGIINSITESDPDSPTLKVRVKSAELKKAMEVGNE